MTPRLARAEGWPSVGGGERARGEKDKCHDDNDGGAEAEAVATTGLCENIIKQHRSYFYFAPANIVVGLSVLAFGNIITTVSIARPRVRQLRIRVLNRKLVESRFFLSARVCSSSSSVSAKRRHAETMLPYVRAR